MKALKFLLKFAKYLLIIMVLLIVLMFVAQWWLVLSPPEIDNKKAMNDKVEQYSDSLSLCGTAWMHQNTGNIRELYVEGKPFEMGVRNGKLTQELAAEQEQYFFNFIKSLIPSDATLKYLRYFISFFNKDLDEYISLELRKEIYGVSLYASDKFDFVGDKYHRILNYHAAHDIGHTIQNMNLVNCTAFSIKNKYTKDSSLFIGRNLDFSAGDDFARNKIVAFCNPDSGYKFAYITWAGMIGVLSGMNEQGLTVTLNSAKSGIPLSAKSPVSLIARDVLQHAKNIDEAYTLISQHESFVSESFFVGSANDNKAVIIEKSLEETAIYDSGEDKLVLTNHFQSDKLKDSDLNKESIAEGCSMYRWERNHELIDSHKQIDQYGMVEMLRDKNGKNNESIGLGNESALNQLICHHSVVFQPQKRLMWVSEFPYQENGYVAYDLNAVFADTFDILIHKPSVDSLYIEASEFYKTGGVDKIWEQREFLASIKNAVSEQKKLVLEDSTIDKTISANPDFYYTHYVLGLYYKNNTEYEKAVETFNKALDCQIPRMVDRDQIKEELKAIYDQKLLK